MVVDMFARYRVGPEYTVEVPKLYRDDRVLRIDLAAAGGGTVGKAYADNAWIYHVTCDGELVVSGDDLRSGGLGATHARMAVMLAAYLAADIEIIAFVVRSASMSKPGTRPPGVTSWRVRLIGSAVGTVTRRLYTGLRSPVASSGVGWCTPVPRLTGLGAGVPVHTSESEVCVVVSRDVVSVSVRDWHVTHVSDDPECGKCDPVPSNVVEPPGLVDAVVAAIETALWSGTDPDSDDGQSLQDAGYDAGDVAAVAVDALAGDLAEFWHAHAGDLAGIDPAQIGHDFVLTRNGHGAGFWDRGLGDRGDRLTAACKPYGEWDLYPGDDGLLYS